MVVNPRQQEQDEENERLKVEAEKELAKIRQTLTELKANKVNYEYRR